LPVASNTGRSLCFNLRGDGLFRDILSAVLDEIFLTEWTTRLVNDFTLYGNQLAFAALEMIGPASQTSQPTCCYLAGTFKDTPGSVFVRANVETLIEVNLRKFVNVNQCTRPVLKLHFADEVVSMGRSPLTKRASPTPARLVAPTERALFARARLVAPTERARVLHARVHSPRVNAHFLHLRVWSPRLNARVLHASSVAPTEGACLAHARLLARTERAFVPHARSVALTGAVPSVISGQTCVPHARALGRPD